MPVSASLLAGAGFVLQQDANPLAGVFILECV
jgi:hypothetical protein